MINRLPAETPVTTPVEDPIVASDGLLLIHVPPPGVDDKVVEFDTQVANVPVIAVGSAFTVTAVIVEQPLELRVKVIGAVPEDTLVTIPLTDPIVATPVAPLTHVPDPDASLNVIVLPWQKGTLLLGGTGTALTVITLVAGLPQGGVYDMVVVPLDIAVTTPAELIVPTAGLLLLQVPVANASVSVVVAPGQIAAVPPDMAGADGHHCNTLPFAGKVVKLNEVLHVVDDAEGSV